MEKRNKSWRRAQQKRVFKSRMVYQASFMSEAIDDEGNIISHPHWFDLAKMRWSKVYKTTGTPCSCWMCKGETYNRLAYKKETKRIVNEAND